MNQDANQNNNNQVDNKLASLSPRERIELLEKRATNSEMGLFEVDRVIDIHTNVLKIIQNKLDGIVELTGIDPEDLKKFLFDRRVKEMKQRVKNSVDQFYIRLIDHVVENGFVVGEKIDMTGNVLDFIHYSVAETSPAIKEKLLVTKPGEQFDMPGQPGVVFKLLETYEILTEDERVSKINEAMDKLRAEANANAKDEQAKQVSGPTADSQEVLSNPEVTQENNLPEETTSNL